MEYVDESKIDWSGLGDAVEKEYHELLKKHGLPIEDDDAVDAILREKGYVK